MEQLRCSAVNLGQFAEGRGVAEEPRTLYRAAMRRLLYILLGCSLLGVTACTSGSPADKAAVTAAAEGYFRALTTQDCEDLRRFTAPSETDACEDLKERAHQHFGVALEYGSVTVKGDEAVQKMTVGGTGTYLKLRRIDGRWLAVYPPGLQRS